MPTRNVTLTPEQDAFVEAVVRSGTYADASEALRDAVRDLQRRHQQDALKLQVLQTQVDAGIAALKRGDYVEIEDADLDAYFDSLVSAAPR
jgi:antitoxin ParD1/3/4